MNDGQYLVTLTLSFRFAFATIKYHLGMSVYDIFAVECFLAWNFNVNCYLLIETSKNENLKLPTVTYKITTCEKMKKRPLSRSTSSIFSPCFIIYYWEPWGGPCVAKVQYTFAACKLGWSISRFLWLPFLVINIISTEKVEDIEDIWNSNFKMRANRPCHGFRAILTSRQTREKLQCLYWESNFE